MSKKTEKPIIIMPVPEDVPLEQDDDLTPSFRTEEFYAVRDDFRDDARMKICPTCNGEDEDCEMCGGEGEIEDDEQLDLNYPDDEDANY